MVAADDAKSGFSDAERAAMQQRAEELRSTKGVKGAAKRAREHQACLDALEALEGSDRVIGERLHLIVAEEAPDLDAKTFYGFPAYARDGKVIVFFQPKSKFDTRYGTISFDESANLDSGAWWPTSFAVIEMTAEVEASVRELVRRAVS